MDAPEVASSQPAQDRRLRHLALASDWEAAQRVGEYRISTLGATLAQVGFIHLSFPHQLCGVAERFYRDVREDLVVLDVDGAAIGDLLVVEPGAPDPGAELFPHLYGPLPVAAVTAVRAASFDDAGRLVIG